MHPYPATNPGTMPTGSSTLSRQTRPASVLSGPLVRSLRAGALLAIGTWAIVVLPALVGWVSAPESSLGWFSAVSVGSAIWFLGHAQSIGGAGLTISVTPILLLLVFILLARRVARRLLATERAEVRARDWSGLIVRQIAPGFLLGYLSVAAVAALLTFGSPVGPGVAALPGSLIVPVAGLGACLLRPNLADPWGPAQRVFDRVPAWLAVAWRAGWRGAWLLFALGLGVVVLRLLGSLDTVIRVHGEYDINLVAGLALALAQLAFVGNLATWGLSFLAGPGFSVAAGGAIWPAAAHPGMVPLVPVLGALPDEATYSWPMWLVLLAPVAAGVVIGRWADRDRSEPRQPRDRLLAVGIACVIAVVVVAILTALGAGSVGSERLSAIGPPTLLMTGALLLESLAGAMSWVGYRMLQDRRPLS